VKCAACGVAGEVTWEGHHVLRYVRTFSSRSTCFAWPRRLHNQHNSASRHNSATKSAHFYTILQQSRKITSRDLHRALNMAMSSVKRLVQARSHHTVLWPSALCVVAKTSARRNDIALYTGFHFSKINPVEKANTTLCSNPCIFVTVHHT
jgi:hypothetical protein